MTTILTHFFANKSRFLSDKSGATAIEYGLIAALVSVVIITAVTLMGDNLDATFNAIAGALAPPP